MQHPVMILQAAKTFLFLYAAGRLVQVGIVEASLTNPFHAAKFAAIHRRHGLELQTLDEGMSLAAHGTREGGERNFVERG